MAHKTPATPSDDVDRIGESKRDYPHSSGDRNTKSSESDWPEYEGGEQRDAPPAPPTRKG